MVGTIFAKSENAIIQLMAKMNQVLIHVVLEGFVFLLKGSMCVHQPMNVSIRLVHILPPPKETCSHASTISAMCLFMNVNPTKTVLMKSPVSLTQITSENA